MTTRDRKIVNVAEREIDKFVKKWERNPYLWESEADVNGELYARIKSAIYKIVKPSSYPYDDMSGKERFERIYCGYKTYFKGIHPSRPDIIIYKKFAKNVREGRNEPMLWVCEIKYGTEWSSSVTSDNVDKDIKKLKVLLKQKNTKIKGTDYAYLLVLMRWDKKGKINKRIEKIEEVVGRPPQPGKKITWCWKGRVIDNK